MARSTRWGLALLAVLWGGWMLALGIGQARRVPGLSPDTSETVQHLVAFAVLGALAMSAVRARPIAVFAGLVALGVLGELLQLTTADRKFQVIDVIADAIGAAIGIAIVLRFPGRATSAVLAVVTVSLMVLAPLAPEAIPKIQLTYGEDCIDPPPAGGAEPTVILDALQLDDVELPHELVNPPVADLRAAILATNELTVETWFETSDLAQRGPARVFTISDGTREDQVNVHIGIEGDDASVRLRTSCNIFKRAGAVDVIRADQPQHVLFTWRSGRLVIWVNGVEVSATNNRWGDFARWDPDFHILIGDEQGGGRRFDGTVYSVTMWDGALTDAAIIERASEQPERPK